MQTPTILIIGMSAGGADSLPNALIERIACADLLVGGARHLAYFSAFRGATVAIGADLDPAIAQLRLALESGRRAVVLASGDPLCYGIGASLRRVFLAEALEIVPAPSAFQLAFAALAEPWHNAALLSAHARSIADVVAGVIAAPLAAILTDNRNTPAAIARALLDADLPGETRCAICENLGAAEQRIVYATLAEAETSSYAPLNVLVVWNDQEPRTENRRTENRRTEEPKNREPRTENREQSPVGSTGNRRTGEPENRGPTDPETAQFSIFNFQFSIPAGLPDEAFSTSAGQITKREVRLLSLAELALGPGEVLWDVGAGSGAVAIEAARAQPSAPVYAIERRAVMCGHMRENMRRFPAANLELVQGSAPEDCASWPDPHAVFVGGSGGQLAAIIHDARRRLRPGGRLVINLVTLEHLQLVRTLLPDARVTQAQFSRGVPIQDLLRFEALNPVFVVTWVKAGNWKLRIEN